MLLSEFRICGFSKFGLMLLFFISCNVLVLGHHECTYSFIVYFPLSPSDKTCSLRSYVLWHPGWVMIMAGTNRNYEL